MPTRNDPIVGLQWTAGSVRTLVHKKMQLKGVCTLGTSINMWSKSDVFHYKQGMLIAHECTISSLKPNKLANYGIICDYQSQKYFKEHIQLEKLCLFYGNKMVSCHSAEGIHNK